jgi:hypothetical protein
MLEREEAFACAAGRNPPATSSPPRPRRSSASTTSSGAGSRLHAAKPRSDRRVRWHDLRHCDASLLIFEGATVEYISRRLGGMSLRRARVLVLAVILALVAAGCGGGGKLGAKALSQQSKSLQSLAAEGALLAQDAVSGKTTRIYTREHSSDLYKAASQAEASLKAAKTEPALQPKLRQLVILAAQVSAALKRLGGASKEEERALGRELQTAARESKTIGKGLK